jgi:hypothetical protein
MPQISGKPGPVEIKNIIVNPLVLAFFSDPTKKPFLFRCLFWCGFWHCLPEYTQASLTYIFRTIFFRITIQITGVSATHGVPAPGAGA